VRVLFVTHNIPRFSGDVAGSFVLRLARALVDIGVKVDVIAPGTNELVGDDVVDGIRIRRVRYAADMTIAYGGTMAEAVASSNRGRLAFAGLFRALRKATLHFLDEARRAGEPVDVVHAHWWIPAGVAVWLSRFGKSGSPPYIVTMHGSDVRLAQKITLAHPLMRRVLGRAALVTAVSRWLCATAMRIAPQVEMRVGSMPVDDTQFVPDASYVRHRSVLFVGRLNAQKGIADLMDALSRPCLAGVLLDIVGDGPDAHALREREAALGLGTRVTWHGRLPATALLPLYRSCGVVAIPSREEGLGLVAVEAQLCATPVVAYASGGLTDVVMPEHGGVLAPTGDIDALAQSIARVLDDPARAAHDGERARHAMLQRFSPSAVAGQYVQWYEQAIAARA
jgi:glycosyltransferase involved in cell wall biosynthesis